MANETLKIRFLDFVFRWWGVFASLIVLVGSCAVLFVLKQIFSFKSVIPLLGFLGAAIALLILTTVAFYKYRKRRYGIGWGEGDAGYRETYASDEKPRKNLAKHKPDTLSDAAIDEKLKHINKRRGNNK